MRLDWVELGKLRRDLVELGIIRLDLLKLGRMRQSWGYPRPHISRSINSNPHFIKLQSNQDKMPTHP